MIALLERPPDDSGDVIEVLSTKVSSISRLLIFLFRIVQGIEYPMPVSMEKRLKPLRDLAVDKLMIHEIYGSIQGESTYAGLPCTFVRTTACNLRCTWCDTAHAFGKGKVMEIDEVFDHVSQMKPRLVEITGGEPLLQPAVLPLMTKFLDAGFQVLLETSGSLDIGKVDSRVVKIVDFKAPGSGEVEANDWGNIEKLSPHDEIKFVLQSREDYEWARDVITEHRLAGRCELLTSLSLKRWWIGLSKITCPYVCSCKCINTFGIHASAAFSGFFSWCSQVCRVSRGVCSTLSASDLPFPYGAATLRFLVRVVCKLGLCFLLLLDATAGLTVVGAILR
jgi:7-carboxy-7-deazaguanine synthase